MEQILPQIENIIAEAGVLQSCDDVCQFFQGNPANGICNLACDIVGVRGFVDILNVTDPNPIFLCQAFFLCPEVAGGAVTVEACYASPTVGPRGTIFSFYLNYTVTSPTGPGLFALAIGLTGGNSSQSYQDAVFTEGQSVGTYSSYWEVQAEPSEQESFDKGTYTADLAVCAGDCSTVHDYSGVYGFGQTKFTITDDMRA